MQRSGRKVQRSRQKVQRSAASAQVGKGCSNNIQLQPPPPPPTRTNTAQCSNHSITATCVRVCKEFVCPYASCSDCCIVLCWSWAVAVVVVVECCYCIPHQLALMPVLTFAPCALTFVPCACGVILLSTSASTPLAHMVVVTTVQVAIYPTNLNTVQVATYLTNLNKYSASCNLHY